MKKVKEYFVYDSCVDLDVSGRTYSVRVMAEGRDLDDVLESLIGEIDMGTHMAPYTPTEAMVNDVIQNYSEKMGEYAEMQADLEREEAGGKREE